MCVVSVYIHREATPVKHVKSRSVQNQYNYMHLYTYYYVYKCIYVISSDILVTMKLRITFNNAVLCRTEDRDITHVDLTEGPSDTE